MDLLTELAILVLAAFVGFEVISKVPNTLHTPLMSGTNAIHGIVLLGGLLVIGPADGVLEDILVVIAIAFGTIIVVGGTLIDQRIGDWVLIVIGLVIGTAVGVPAARSVRMTAMPQMVALFNGFGGGAAALVALADYHDTVGLPGHVEGKIIASILFSAAVGSISFSGSMIAFGKLQEMISGSPVVVPGQRIVTGALVAAVLVARSSAPRTASPSTAASTSPAAWPSTPPSSTPAT